MAAIDELLNNWTAAKKAADAYEAEHNRTQSIHRGDPEDDFRAEGAFYEIDRLREIERAAEARYWKAVESNRR
jgi:hypothetical protein